MVKEQKTTKSFFWALFVKCFHNYKLLFFHVYQLYVLIYGLKFIWEFLKLEKKKSLLKWPLKIFIDSILEIHN